MSQTIDTKVVEMQFDNRQFERNVGTSLSTLDKLKASLKFDSASDGLERMSKSMKKLDFNPATTSIVVLQEKFSALERVAIGVLENIGATISNYLIKTINSVTLEPITKGWTKYADKTTAIQTIMAATADEFTDTGKQMEFVNDQLEKLNWFTDETSYNFLDMVSNIGKFTSNKISLEDSVTAMQGISTWAAISGANAQQASHAMYNLSQAMATGSVKLIDWKSIENANMATAGFKQTVIDTAVELGTLKKVGEGTYKTLSGKSVSVRNFNEELKEGWFTAEVLMKTLDQYGGFTNALYEATEKTGLSASQMLGAIEDYTSGKKTLGQISKELEVDAETLGPLLKDLGSDTYELGRRSFAAAQEAKTFKEAIDSVVDAVSSKWMNIFEILFGNYLEAKELWTTLAEELYEIFVEPLNTLEGFLKEALRVPQVLEGSLDAHDIRYNMGLLSEEEFSAFESLFVKLARSHGIAIDTMIRQDGSFRKTLQRGWLTNDLFDDMLGIVVDGQAQGMDKIHEAAMAVIRGDYGNDMSSRMDALTAAGYDAEAIQNYVNILYKLTGGTWDLSDAILEAADAEAGLTSSIADMSDEELAAMGLTQEDIKTLRLYQEEAQNADSKIGKFTKTLYGREGGELLIEAVGNILSNIPTLIDVVSEAWKNIFPPMTTDQAYDIIVKFHEFSESLILSEETTGKLNTVLMGLFSVLKIVKNAIGAVAKVAIPPLMKGLSFVGSKALDIFADLGSRIKSFSDLVESVGFGKAIDEVAPRLSKFGNIVKTKFRGGLIGIVKSLTGFYDIPENLRSGAEAMYESMPTLKLMSIAFDGLKSKVVSFATSLKEGIKNSKFGQALANSFEKANSAIAEGVDPVKAYVGSLRQNFPIFDKFIHFLGDIKNVAGRVKDILVNTFKEVKERFSNFMSGSGDGENPIVKWFEQIKNIPIIGTVSDMVVNAFGSIKSAVLGFFDSVNALGPDATLFDIFDLLIGNIKSGINKALDWIKGQDILGSLLEALHDLFFGMSVEASEVTQSPEVMEEGAAAVGDSLIEIIKGKILSTVKAIGDVLSDFKMEDLTGVLGGLMAVLTGVAIIKAMKAIRNIGESITSTLSSFASIAKAEADARLAAADAQKKKAYTALIVGIAASILIVVAAIYILTNKVDQDRIWPAIGVIAVIAAIIVAMVALLGVIQKKLGNGGAALRDAGIGILALAVGLFILYHALNSLKDLDLSGMSLTTKVLLGVIVGLFVLFGIFSKTQGDVKAGIGGAIQLIAFSMAIRSVAKSLKTFAKLLNGKNGKQVNKAMVLLVAVIGTMTVAMIALSKVKGADKSGRAMLAMSASLLLMVVVIKAFAKLKIETLLKALPGLIVAIASISLLMSAISKAGEHSTKAGVSLLLISGALLVMTGVIYILGNMPFETALKGIAALFGMTLSLAILLAVVGASGPNAIKAGIAAAFIAVALVAMSYAVSMLSLLDEEKLAVATAALGTMTLVFGLVLALSKFATPSIKSILGYVLVIVTITGSLWFLTTLDMDKLTTAVMSLCGVLIAVSAAMALASFGGANPLGGLQSALKIILFLGTIVVALGAIATLLDVAGVEPEAIKEKIESLAPILESLGTLIGSLIHGVLGSLKDDALMEQVKDLISFVTSLYSSDSLPDPSQSGILEWFAGKSGSGLDVVGKDMIGLAKGIKEFAIALGEFDMGDDLQSRIDIAKDLTTFVIGLYNGTGEQKLPEPSQSSLLEWMVGKTNSKLDVVGKDMENLANGIKEFCRALGVVGTDAKFMQQLEIAKDLTTFVIGLYNGTGEQKLPEPSESSIWEWMVGKTNSGLDVVGVDMETLALGIREFVNALGQINTSDDMLGRLDVAKSLTEFVIGLYHGTGDQELPDPSDSSVWEWMAGKTGSGLDVVGKDTQGLAKGITEFAVALRLIQDSGEDLTSKVAVIKDLTSFIISLYSSEQLPDPNAANLWDWMNGRTKSGLDVVGKDLVNVGKGLVEMALAIGCIQDSGEDLTSKIDAIKDITSFIVALYSGDQLPDPSESNLWEWMAGKTGSGLDSVGKDIGTLANGLSDFAEAIGESEFANADVEKKIDASKNLATFIVGLYKDMNALPAEGETGLLEWAEKRVGLGSIGQDMEPLATGLADYASIIGQSVFSSDPDFQEKIQASQNLADFIVGLYKNANTLPADGEEGLLEWAQKRNDLGDIGRSAGELAEGLKEYCDKINVTTFNPMKIAASQWLGEMLVSLNGKLPDNDVIDWLTGEDKKLLKFAKQLPTLGEKLVEYANNVKGLDSDAATKGVEAATMLAELAASLSGVDLGDGWLDPGALDSFGLNIIGLGHYLGQFASAELYGGSTVIDTDRLKIIGDAIRAIVDLGVNMDAVIASEDKIGDVEAVISGIGKWPWNEIEAVDVSNLEPLRTTLTELSNILTNEELLAAQEKIAAIGSVVSGWTDLVTAFYTAGENTGQGLIDGILAKEEDAIGAGVTLAEHIITSYSETMDEGSPSKVMEAHGENTVAGLLIGISNKLGELEKAGETMGLSINGGVEGLLPSLEGVTDSTVKSIVDLVNKKKRDIGKATTNFATSALKGLTSKIGTITGDGLMGAMPNALADAQDWISDHKSKIQNATKEYSESTLEGIKTNIGTVTSGQGIAGAVPDALRNVRSWVSNNLGIFRSSGNAITSNYSNGMASNSNAIRNNFPNWVRAAKSAAGSVSTYSTGQYFTQGFINGAGSLRSRLNELARSLAAGAIAELKQRLAERSPSKETFKIGAFFTEGFENGIVSRARMVKVVTTDMAETALDGMATSMGLISDIITNGMDGDPVIRPVLDLSEIQNGVGAINGMMAFNTPYSVMANVNGINASMMASRQRRMSESDVVDAINKLGDNMPATGDTYNVNGVTYDDGTNVATAVRSLIRAANINRRS